MENAERINLIDDAIHSVHLYLSSTSENFEGTATKLSKEIVTATGRNITPAVLRKKLMKHHGELMELSWRCSFRQTRNEKIIKIEQTESAAVDALPYAKKTL